MFVLLHMLIPIISYNNLLRISQWTRKISEEKTGFRRTYRIYVILNNNKNIYDNLKLLNISDDSMKEYLLVLVTCTF